MTKEQYEKISNQIEELYKIINEGKGYNPYRDSKGRFANGPKAAFGEYAPSHSEMNANKAGFSPDADDKVPSRLGRARTEALVTTASAVSKVSQGPKIHADEMRTARKLDNARDLDSALFRVETLHGQLTAIGQNIGRLASHKSGFGDSAAESAKDFIRRDTKDSKDDIKTLESKAKTLDKYSKILPKTVKNLKDRINVYTSALNTYAEISKNIDMKAPVKQEKYR